eukprot:1185751-Prorocentrum_minimum.AAC.1
MAMAMSTVPRKGGALAGTAAWAQSSIGSVQRHRPRHVVNLPAPSKQRGIGEIAQCFRDLALESRALRLAGVYTRPTLP